MSYKEYTVRVHDNRTLWLVDNKLHRENGPAAEWCNGDREWFLNGNLHRDDGPAVEYMDGLKEWWINGERHREDGPAVECAGEREWWVKGERLTEEEFNARTQTCDGKIVEIEGKKYKLTEV